MSEVFIIAKQDRRRGGMRFQKGVNGPYKISEIDDVTGKAIDADPLLSVTDEDPAAKSGKKKSGKKKPSAAEAKVQKQRTELTKEIKALPEGVEPDATKLSIKLRFSVTAEEIKAIQETLE